MSATDSLKKAGAEQLCRTGRRRAAMAGAVSGDAEGRASRAVQRPAGEGPDWTAVRRRRARASDEPGHDGVHVLEGQSPLQDGVRLRDPADAAVGAEAWLGVRDRL